MGRSRSRDRKRRKRRSRSEESAERSREREKRRRRQQNQYLNNHGKQKAAQLKAQNEGLDGGGPKTMFWDGFQWIPKAEGAATGDHTTTRKLRRLYLGNLPYHLGITEEMFQKTLRDAMIERGICADRDENPVLHVWFARDKGQNYGFVEIGTAEEAERVLSLDGLSCLGVPITIKRPNDFVGVPTTAGAGPLALTAPPPAMSSKIVVISGVLKNPDTCGSEEYKDVLEDMVEGCGAHGKIVKQMILSPQLQSKFPDFQAGQVFLEFATQEESENCARKMCHRKYDGNQIVLTSCSEGQWERLKVFA